MAIRGKLGLATVASCAAALAISAAPAGANFSSPYTNKCTGSSITGKGASFQNTLQTAWASKWAIAGAYCASPFGTSGNTVSYLGGGSGVGRTAFGAIDTPGGARDATVAYAGVDEPPTPTQLANANEGPNVDAGADSDDGALRTIPVASGAVAIVMNYPDGCSIPSDYAWNKTGAPANTTRVKLSRQKIERAFAGEPAFDTWGELMPTIDPACANLPIKRVVRLDVSGTTFQLKNWLDLQRPTRQWREDQGVYSNTQWPNEATNPVLRGAANGNGPALDVVNATDGSIGYADLATARAKGFDKDSSAADTTFWIPVPDQAGSFKEPTFSSSSFLTGPLHQSHYGSALKKGANCRTTVYSNVPDQGAAGLDAADTLGSWSSVTGVAAGANGGYPICLLTYALAWDDSYDALGGELPPTNPRPAEAKQRTVRDFLFYALSNTGQNVGDINDYARVPDSLLLNVARPAQLELNYHK